MTYVLIIMLWWGDRIATTTQEFTTLERCETAAKKAQKEWNSTYSFRYTCTEK
jgi:hypothetical protein